MSLNETRRTKVAPPTAEELRAPTHATSGLPNTFGNNWSDRAFRANHHKKQHLSSESAGKLGDTYVKTLVKPPPVAPEVTTAQARELMASFQATRDHVISGKLSADPIVREDNYDVDDKVLRFFAYFRETIRESAVETVRVRKVSVSFFLSDETLLIQEKHVQNSGLTEGTFLKRQRVPIAEPDAVRRPVTGGGGGGESGPKHITLNDIVVGGSIVVFGQRYHVYACDGFTREFLTAIGADVEQDGPEPDDDYQTVYRAQRVNGKDTRKSFETKDLSATMESLASKGRCAQHYPGETLRTQRFIRDSGKVLAFRALWVDEAMDAKGVPRTLEIRFFVEDDTIMIAEEGNPVTKTEARQRTFLSRRRLPVSGKPNKTVEVTFAGRINGQAEAFLGSEDRYYELHDLYIGAEVNVFGRMLKVFSCDGYTREFLATELGIDVGEPIDINDVFPKPVSRKAPPPPPTGFGTEEDSLASCNIQLKPMKRDMSGHEKHGSEVLRFEMIFAKPQQPEDRLRKFLLTYFLADKELMITERAVRNTGFTGGKFLKKQRVEKNKGKCDYFQPEDFVVGGTVKLLGFLFTLTGMDEHSERYRQFESTRGRDPETLKAVPAERLQTLLEKFREYVQVRYYTNTEAFRCFDLDHDGAVSLDEMKEVLKGSQITADEEEAIALVKLFDRHGDGFVSYADFMHAVSLNGGPDAPREAVSTDGELCYRKATDAASNNRRRALLKRLFERFEARCMNGFEMFRLLSTMPRAFRGKQTVELAALTNGNKDTVVTPVQVRRGVREVLGMPATDDEMAIILAFFFPSLPPSQFNAPSDRTAQYSMTLTVFQEKLTQMSGVGQLAPMV